MRLLLDRRARTAARIALIWHRRTGALTAIVALGGLLTLLTLWLESMRRELGVRRAVGATRGTVHRLVASRAVRVGVSGPAIGPTVQLLQAHD
jgi:site-specific recombinase